MGPSPFGLVTVFYCLRFETSLFIASYDSQGHGGGIWPRLHTGISDTCERITCHFLTQCGPQTEHILELFVCCNLPIRCHGNACLPNRCPATVYCRGNVLSEAPPSRWWYSGFQASWHTTIRQIIRKRRLVMVISHPGERSDFISGWDERGYYVDSTVYFTKMPTNFPEFFLLI
jgi:hypothetical protein